MCIIISKFKFNKFYQVIIHIIKMKKGYKKWILDNYTQIIPNFIGFCEESAYCFFNYSLLLGVVSWLFYTLTFNKLLGNWVFYIF